ncbi:MAG: hypothetical protein WAU24_05035, partial [Chitinophagaceae bacterium]
MKFLLKIIFLMLLPVMAMAQDSVIDISPANFSEDIDAYNISAVPGWSFHAGNDPNWAQENIDLSGWKKLSPSELSGKYADKDGKAEGWFRTKIKFDSSAGNKLFGVKLGSWAATDLYINGQLITSNGNTGSNGEPYKAINSYGKLSYPANLRTGEVYTLAVHFVDHKSILHSSQLKSEASGSLNNFLNITGSKFDSAYAELMNQDIAFMAIDLSAFAILMLLFWILLLQNPAEKNLRLIAYGTTVITLTFYSSMQSALNSNYTATELWKVINGISAALSFVLVMLIIINIFNRKVTKAFKVFLVAYFIGLFSIVFMPEAFAIANNLIMTALLFIICIYYTVSSWKNLKGAQWAVVTGLLVFTLFVMVFFIIEALPGNTIKPIALNLLRTSLALSFPISLLVYVSIRFKEIITDVQLNANRVLHLSEEKKEQALHQQKILQEEVTKQTAEIRTTLDNLKSTQSQLIQSEKMASLGELTAGIAHEIQNPLNFVNNFSEINKEMIGEMKEEIAKGNYDDVKNIANDIEANEEKINHHGKRADAIVKGMLQHSQTSKGQKEPTNINALCDEYLRLSYHGLRA